MMKQLFRRFSPLVLSLLLIVSLLPQQAHAASAGLDASTSYLRVGNSFTLYLYVSGSEVAGIEASLSYDSSALTYNGYSNYIGGSWVLSESSRNFTMYNSAGGTFSGSPYLISLSFTVKSGASEGADLSVSVSGTASEGGSDSSFYASWSSEVLPPLSGNANLDDLWCDNAELNFTGGTEYSITVPYEVSFLELDWDRAHSGSYVSVSGNSLSVGSNTVTVTVEAENGNTKRYYIYVTREQDPNYVPSSDATLSSLSPSTGTLSPAFAADVTDYVLYVPYETSALSINGSANDSKARGVSTTRKVLIPPSEDPADGEETPADTNTGTSSNPPAGGEPLPEPEPEYRVLSDNEPLPEGETIYTVTCTAEDGTTTMDYTVHVIRMPLYAGMLPEIIPPVTEPVEPEPEPEPTTYDISLPLVMTLPYIGEVTLQQAALGAAIVLGVLLLLLLLLAWLIGRAGGKRKALRKLAEAQRRPDAPEEALLTRLAAAQTEVEEPAPAEESQVESPTEAETPTVTEEAPAPAEEPADEEVIPEETAEELPAEEDTEADTLPEDTAAMPLCESTEEPAEDTEEAAPAEELDESPEDAAQSAPQEEASDSTAVSEDASAEDAEETPQEEADEAVSAMSLEQLLEDIRNM